MLADELKYWTKRRTLLNRFRSEILPYKGKTETTVRLQKSVQDSLDAILEWDEANVPLIGHYSADRPEYRVRVPGGRVLRIGTEGIDAAIQQAENHIHALDEADTYEYDRLITLRQTITKLAGEMETLRKSMPVSASQAFLRWDHSPRMQERYPA